MSQFQPEIGQMIFGQPYLEHSVPNIMKASLSFISDRLVMVMWNIHQREYHSPMNNSGSKFKNDTFEANAYDWSDKEQPYNFAWRDLRVSWYKHLGRGMSANMDISAQMASDCLEDCLRSLDEMDDKHRKARGF